MNLQRPQKLSSQTELGLYTSWLPDSLKFEKFVEQAVLWAESAPGGNEKDGENYSYGILDTFFADFISTSCVKKILDSCSSSSPLRVLLLDPTSPYAIARASHLTSNAASARMAKGLAKLAQAAHQWADSQESNQVSSAINRTNDFAAAASDLQETVSKYGVPLELRFYSVIPSGPLLFLQDILISGKFCFDRSSTQLPWYMHVDDPEVAQNAYAIHLSEFNNIWELETTSPEIPITFLKGDRGEGDGRTLFKRLGYLSLQV